MSRNFLRLALAAFLMGALASCDDGDITSLLSGVPGHYDDFTEGAIDPARWSVDTSGGGTQSVTNGFAVLAVNTAGGDMQSSLLFPAAMAPAVRSITAAVIPLAYVQDPTSSVRFRLFMRAYKDDKYAGTGLTSDVFAQLRIRDQGAGPEWQAMVSRCIDSGCSSENPFPALALMPANLDQLYVATVAWDGNTGFSFSVNGTPATSFDASEGAYTNIGPPGTPATKLESIATSGAPTIGAVSAAVDWVACTTSSGPC